MKVMREKQSVREEAMRESGVFFCGIEGCQRAFMSEFWRVQHQAVCKDRRTKAAKDSPTIALRPVADLLLGTLQSSGRIVGGGPAGEQTGSFSCIQFKILIAYPHVKFYAVCRVHMVESVEIRPIFLPFGHKFV